MPNASTVKRNHYKHKIKEIQDFSEIVDNEPMHYVWKRENIELEFLYKPSPNSKGLVVVFHGAGVHGDGSRPLLPIFRLHDLSIENVSVLSLSDPVLKQYRKNDLLLSWFLDTHRYQPSLYIQEIIAHIKLRENSQNILFMGTSGAGFVALKYACIFKEKVLVSNAQFFIQSFFYYQKFDAVLCKHNDAVTETINAEHLLAKYGLPKKVIVYSNTCDNEHHEGQALPFVQYMQNTCPTDCIELRTFSDTGDGLGKDAHCVLWDRPYEDIIKEILFP